VFASAILLITCLTNQTWKVYHSVHITYIEPDGTERVAEAKIGENLMDVAHQNNIELEGMVSVATTEIDFV
jgi:hypothetical protein